VVLQYCTVVHPLFCSELVHANVCVGKIISTGLSPSVSFKDPRRHNCVRNGFIQHAFITVQYCTAWCQEDIYHSTVQYSTQLHCHSVFKTVLHGGFDSVCRHRVDGSVALDSPSGADCYEPVPCDDPRQRLVRRGQPSPELLHNRNLGRRVLLAKLKK